MYNRKIKFRVYDRCHKTCHIVGSDHHDCMHCDHSDNEVFYYNLQNGEGSITYDESISEYQGGYILMQYTGMEDKNRTEIYEGDIVFFDNGQQVFYIGFVMGQWSLCRHLEDPEKDYFNLALYTKFNKVLSIIGNIHENPELLMENRT